MKINDACLTVNFETKNISIDGKAITFDHLNNGNFDTVFDSDRPKLISIRLIY